MAQDFAESTLGATLLTATTIYVKTIEQLLARIEINAIAHITGGGITENLPRVLPSNAQAQIDLGAWTRPQIFNWLQKQGQVTDAEMYRTFNCGIGLIICVSSERAQTALEILNRDSKTAFIIGNVIEKQADQPAIVLT